MAAVAKDSVWNRLPLIVILGATGCGKSKLALEVAQKFKGEIISTDAMQLYQGLDIITNKVTPEERLLVPHHMMDYLSPGQPTKVTEFRDRALPIIDDLLMRNKIPVVAGGTNYYVESLLWKVLVDTTSVPEVPAAKRAKHGELRGLGNLHYLITDESPSTKDAVERLGTEDKELLYTTLKEVDPARADELHPNNVRKVIRSLQVFSSSGRRHSELIKEQREAGGNEKGGPLRYPNCAVFWITCDQAVLEERLDERVDQMIENGLIDELQDFHDQYNKHRILEDESDDKTPLYTLGIFQSIGFKEFHEYLMLDKKQRVTEEGKKVFNKGLELMKIATRQFARRQKKWIMKRFLSRGKDQVPPLYSLNATDLNLWMTEVRNKAFSVVRAMMKEQPIPIDPEPLMTPSQVVHKIVKCEKCDRLFESELQFTQHMASQKHRRRVERLKREGLMKTNSKNGIKE